MTEENRVFITGVSALTAAGHTLNSTWDAILGGQSAIEEITQWNINDWPARLGGEIKNLQPAKMLPDRKLLKVISRQDVLGINAAMQAVDHSQLISYRDEYVSDKETYNNDTAIFVGSPGNKYFQQYDFLPLLAKTNGEMKQFSEQLFNEVHPMWLLRILPNNVLAYTGITYGFKGPNHNITNHAVSGTQAILEAYHAIRTGQVERAIVIAYDVGTEPQALFYYDQLGVISSRHLKPFDAQHDGTLLAEGAAALVLESEASANARNAVNYGEILGGLSTSEASGLFSIQHDGQLLAQLLQKTLKKLNLSPNDIDSVVAHGNGNKKSDESEASAIQQTFSHTVPVTAFKWAMGHTLCASGILDTALATCALTNHLIPGIATLETPASSCEHLNISSTQQTLDKTGAHALIINRGFASMNACVVIKACD